MMDQLVVGYLTITQACKYLSVGRTTLYMKVKEGKISRTIDGGLVRFDIKELDRYMNVHKVRGEINGK